MSRPQSPPVRGEHLMIVQEMSSWQDWPIVQSGLDLDKKGLSCRLTEKQQNCGSLIFHHMTMVVKDMLVI